MLFIYRNHIPTLLQLVHINQELLHKDVDSPGAKAASVRRSTPETEVPEFAPQGDTMPLQTTLKPDEGFKKDLAMLQALYDQCVSSREAAEVW